jgi:hypothetical protein
MESIRLKSGYSPTHPGAKAKAEGLSVLTFATKKKKALGAALGTET